MNKFTFEKFKNSDTENTMVITRGGGGLGKVKEGKG